MTKNANCELSALPLGTIYKLIHSKTAVDASFHSSSVSGEKKHDKVDEIHSQKTNTDLNIGFDSYRFKNLNFVSRAYGIFNEYPPGILNPAFCAMILEKLTPHPFT